MLDRYDTAARLADTDPYWAGYLAGLTDRHRIHQTPEPALERDRKPPVDPTPTRRVKTPVRRRRNIKGDEYGLHYLP